MAIDTDGIMGELEGMGAEAIDALLRIVTGAADGSPELLRRAGVVAKMRLEGIPETAPMYVLAIEDVQAWGVLLLQRAQLQTEAETKALVQTIVKWALKVASAVLAAAI
jgi:hypothetical protein